MERECPVCNYSNEPMGTLGNRVHYRCRACGLMYSHPKRDYETCDEFAAFQGEYHDID